jgi:hypothetical protein
MPRACIFCGASAGSAEHLFPNWLNGVLPPPPTGTADYERRQASDSGVETRSWSIARAASETTNWVCHRCNTGWMSRLEERAKVHLVAAISGRFCRWKAGAQLDLATWATKTAMVLEATTSGSDHFSTADRRHVCGDAGSPPTHVWVFASAVAGQLPPLSFFCSRAHATVGGNLLTNLHFYTVQVGALVLQVVRPQPAPIEQNVWTKSFLSLPGERTLMPPVLPEHAWPPKHI